MMFEDVRLEGVDVVAKKYTDLILHSVTIGSYKLSATYIIAQLSVDSILDNNRKTLIVCDKYHLVDDVTILLS